MNLTKPISFTCAVLLFLAIANMPLVYYTFLRLMVTICCIIIIVKDFKTLQPFWVIFFVTTALLFNPFIPVYFYKKSIWLVIDVIAAITFTVYAMQYIHGKKQ